MVLTIETTEGSTWAVTAATSSELPDEGVADALHRHLRGRHPVLRRGVPGEPAAGRPAHQGEQADQHHGEAPAHAALRARALRRPRGRARHGRRRPRGGPDAAGGFGGPTGGPGGGAPWGKVGAPVGVTGAGAGPGHEPWRGGAATGGDDAGRSDHQAVLGSCGGPCSARRRGSGDGKGVGVSMGPASGCRIGACLGLAEGSLGARPRVAAARGVGPSRRPDVCETPAAPADVPDRRSRGGPDPCSPRSTSTPSTRPPCPSPRSATATPMPTTGSGSTGTATTSTSASPWPATRTGASSTPRSACCTTASNARCSPPVGRRSTPRSPPSGPSRSTSPTRSA